MAVIVMASRVDASRSDIGALSSDSIFTAADVRRQRIGGQHISRFGERQHRPETTDELSEIPRPFIIGANSGILG